MIVKARKEDAQILTEIALESRAYWGYSKEQIQSWKSDLTVTEEMFDQWTIFKYMDETKIVGFCILNLNEDSPKAILEFLFVHPKFIGKRIGARLLRHAVYLASSKGRKVMNLEADPYAEPFYTKHGFQIVGKTQSSIPNRFLPIMEKELMS